MPRRKTTGRKRQYAIKSTPRFYANRVTRSKAAEIRRMEKLLRVRRGRGFFDDLAGLFGGGIRMPGSGIRLPGSGIMLPGGKRGGALEVIKTFKPRLPSVNNSQWLNPLPLKFTQ